MFAKQLKGLLDCLGHKSVAAATMAAAAANRKPAEVQLGAAALMAWMGPWPAPGFEAKR
jgi:hypothetical protein